MYRLIITREYYKEGTIGTISYNGVIICNSIELPKKDFPSTLSCIPEGEYPVLIRRTKELGLHLWIADVPVLGHILVHSAFNATDSKDQSIIPVTGISDKGVGTFSTEAMDNLMRVLKPDLFKSKPVTLLIISKTPGYEIKAFSKITSELSAIASQ